MVLNAVSSLRSALQDSLRAGLIRNCSFNVEFRRDVFICLFKDKGKKANGKKGFNYDRSNYTDVYFCDDFLSYITSLVSVVK